MGVFDTFSKRLKKREQAGQADVLQYDDLPQAFRVQVIHICADAIGEWKLDTPATGWWEYIHNQLARELGVFTLSQGGRNGFEKCQEYLLACDTLGGLDLIELAFRVIDVVIRGHLEEYRYRFRGRPTQSPDDAINELNQRFREHGIGYEFAQGELIRKDSQFVHAEVVRPALQLLSQGKCQGPSDEFLGAYEHYRHGRHKEAIVEALKAFESTLKTICDQRGWEHDPNATAKALVNVVVKNGLLPSFTEMQLHAVSNVLESGVPTVRSKLAAHGQGADPVSVDPHFVAFALHSTAANIVLLVQAHQAMK